MAGWLQVPPAQTSNVHAFLSSQPALLAQQLAIAVCVHEPPPQASVVQALPSSQSVASAQHVRL